MNSKTVTNAIDMLVANAIPATPNGFDNVILNVTFKLIANNPLTIGRFES